MFCPLCKDEFRPGFTRCAGCNVDLVESLTAAEPAPTESKPRSSPTATADSPGLVPMREYCGFLSLDDARDSRDRLKADGIRSEIVIRELPDSSTEEYWLRVERDRFGEVFALLGFDMQADDEPEGSFQCGECGGEVAAAESFCPNCGARFEED
jgi:hypothetical protein